MTSTQPDSSTPAVCTVDPYNYLNLTQNPNGQITRPTLTGIPPITTDDHFINPILIKDVPLHPTNKTWFRIYLPRFTPPGTKLPLVIYFHGGGFILFSPTSDLTHNFCTKLAASLPAVVVSLDYRLAPEHKLPAAYEDAVDLVHKVKSSDDELLASYADFSNCFLMGSSSGGNIVYHAGLRLVTAAVKGELEPLRIKGLVLLHAFFSGVERSGSELRMIDGPVLPLSVTDLMWELALPVGADRDHEYCNVVGIDDGERYEDEFEEVKKMGWRVLMVGGKVDPLVDRQMELARMLERRGVDVESEFGEGDVHCIEWFDEGKGRELVERVRKFIIQK